MTKLVLLASYLLLLPIIIFSMLLYALFFAFPSNPGTVNGASVSYTATTDITSGTVHEPLVKEARVEKLENYFSKHNSKLFEHAEFMVKTADAYNLDWRLTAAIAMAESTVCRNEPLNSHNCWGYGITGGKVTWFQSYEDAITEVSRSLSETYARLGLTSPDEIVTRYNPGSTTWAPKVNLFMDNIASM